jgi:NADH-quinone oxidoreductase subunit G
VTSTTDSAAPDSTPDADVPPPDPNAVSVTLNGVPISARKGELIITAAERAGEYIPRFCYHERMSSVGMCRMCLVEVDSGRGPAITPSCMVTVAPDMKIDTQSPTVKRMQEGVLELLLAQHPLDCPVCDKGGECPLQDQTLAYGPGESRFVEEKRHYEKPIPISDLVFLDRERCILCDRCTRFADEVAGDALIHFTSRGNNTQVTTFPDEPFSSYFSGNTVQICPVGALTAKPYRFKARPWDLDETESTCTTCSVGCRTVVQSSRDQLVRTMGVDSDPVNWGWLCDRGRFGFEATNSDQRLGEPLVRTADGLVPTTWSAALQAVATLLTDAKAAGGAGRIGIIGGSRGSNEGARAWARLAREILGTSNLDAQLDDGLPAAVLGLPRATIDQMAAATTVVLLAPDLKEELPVLFLRLRDSVTKRRTKVIELTSKQGGVSSLAWRSITHEPGRQAAAVREALADPAIAAQLAAGPVVVVAGRANLAESPDATLEALSALLAGVPGASVLPALRRGNVVGALQIGLRPGADGLDTRGILQAAADGKLEALVLLGSDPLADVPDTDLATRALAGARRIIAIDTVLNESSSHAHVVLPAAAAGEHAGTTTNLEGRVTRVAQKVTPRGTARPDWMIALGLARALGTDLGWTGVADVTTEIAATVSAYADVTAEALDAHPDGVLTALSDDLGELRAVSSATERNSYDLRLVVSRTLYDQAVGTATSPSLAHLAGPTTAHVHPLDLERAGATGRADVKLSSARGSIVIAVEPDTTVGRGTVWVPFHRPGPDVGLLVDGSAVTDVRIENL